MREPDEITGESGAGGQPAELPAEPTSPSADVTAIRASWRAPLPPPSVLERYDDVLPGAAERTLQMGRKTAGTRPQCPNGDHWHRKNGGIERTVVVSDSRRAYLGPAAGFIISLLVIGGGIYLIAAGHDWAGVVLISINLSSLVGAFIYGSKSRRDERNRNVENTTE